MPNALRAAGGVCDQREAAELMMSVALREDILDIVGVGRPTRRV